MPELLLGCGNSREKKVWLPGTSQTFTDLVTLDIDPRCGADVEFDLDQGVELALPFAENTFGEVHAYEVLEHLGHQGDAPGFFRLFDEIWRILEPDGLLVGTCPGRSSVWIWGDPGHRRVVSRQSVVFLDQTAYQAQVGVTAMTDYRWCYSGDFEAVGIQDAPESFVFILRAHKPPRSDRGLRSV